MTIDRDLDFAISAEATKREHGKLRRKGMRFRMGESAIRALAAVGGGERDGNGFPVSYRSIPIELVDDFKGWELYA